MRRALRFAKELPTYIYEAIDPDGVMHRGELVTTSREQAVGQLTAQRLALISLSARGEKEGARLRTASFFESVSSVDKILLARHMAVMIRAGLGMSDTLNILIGDAEKPVMRRILEQAKYNLERGQQLSTTFASYPRFFPPVFVGLVRAGEMSGNLETTLERLSIQIQKEHELKRNTISVMIYPAILLSASAILVTFLLVFVVPKIANAFLQTGVQLPFITRLMIGISDFLAAPFERGKPMALKIFAGIGFPFSILGPVFFFGATRIGRGILARGFWQVPLTRNLIKKMALARFSRTLGTLLQAGLTILESLQIAADSVGNELYRKNIKTLIEDIRKGLPLTDTFKQKPELYPHLLTSMMAVGEKTGSLEDMLITVSGFYEDDADRMLKNLVALLEPALLLVMGVVVGGIALSILLPIYQLVGSLG